MSCLDLPKIGLIYQNHEEIVSALEWKENIFSQRSQKTGKIFYVIKKKYFNFRPK